MSELSGSDSREHATAEAGSGSQPDQVSAVGIAVAAAALLIGILAVSGILWFAMGDLGQYPVHGVNRGLNHGLKRGAKSHVLPPAGDSVWFTEYSLRAEPPFPLLQTQAAEALRAFRAREDSLLTGYGWTDSAAGKARIPVERAMEILAGRGLSVRMGPDTLP